MRVLIPLLIIFLCDDGYAQNSEIKIFEKETNKPVSFATVSLKGIKSQAIQNGITTDNGLISLQITEASEISVSSIGYKMIVDTIYPGESGTYYLTVDVFNLEQVVVTATRTEKALKDAPVITQVVTARQMKAAGF